MPVGWKLYSNVTYYVSIYYSPFMFTFIHFRVAETFCERVVGDLQLCYLHVHTKYAIVSRDPARNKKLSCCSVTVRCFMSLNIYIAKSLKIIRNGTVRKLGYGFLFGFHSKYSCVLYDFRDIGFFHTPAFDASLGGPRRNIATPFGTKY